MESTATSLAEPSTEGEGSAVEHWVAGAARGGSARTSPVYNPATAQVSRQVNLASATEVDAAVQAAKAALSGWRRTSLAKRSAVMFKLENIIRQRSSEPAALITDEHGKVLSDAEGEIARGLENVQFCAGLM